jgi:hypothetical protein
MTEEIPLDYQKFREIMFHQNFNAYASQEIKAFDQKGINSKKFKNQNGQK